MSNCYQVRHSVTQPSEKICVFCGATGSGVVTREHVLPDWLNKHVVIPSDVGLESWRTSGQLIENRERRGKLFARNPWIACKRCNNGWMSRLEERAIPLLKPMLDGRAVTLGFWDQATLAAWAVKTCLALQWARHDIKSLVPERHFREIACRRGALPPPNAEVFLGYARDIPAEPDQKYHAVAYSARKKDVESDDKSLEGANVYLLTLRISCHISGCWFAKCPRRGGSMGSPIRTLSYSAYLAARFCCCGLAISRFS